MSRDDDPEWDKHTDEIRSIASEELHETRPNRWTGPGSTWRKLTADDRAVYSAIENLRNRDLGLHLYNAFALQRGMRGLGPGEKDFDKTTGQLARRGGGWKPGKQWTAWPLALERVPTEGLMKRDEEDDDDGGDGTFRRPRSREGFGTELEEEVAALMLEMAKEKFRTRQLGQKDRVEPETSVQDPETGGEESDFSLSQTKEEARSGAEEEDEDEREEETAATSEAPRKRQRTKEPGLVPTVSTDDHLSYELLRPVARHLLTQLDKTLAVLHNARMAGINYGAGSDEDQEETRRVKAVSKSPKKKKAKMRRGESSPPHEKPTSRRLDLHTPLEGETEREMAVRLARKYKRRIPRISDEEGETAAGETVHSQTGRRQERGTTTIRATSTASPRKTDAGTNRGERLDNWALRDWSHVLGAAAISGFSPAVIGRATQRCADLFGQGMEFNTLAEEPAADGQETKSRTTRYVPGGAVRPASDEEYDEESAYQSEVEQIRAVSRASSVIMGGSSSDEEGDGPATTTGGNARPRSRSRSATGTKKRSYSVAPSAGNRVFCPYPTCSGAINGFARRYNLKKHLMTVHGKAPEALSEEDADNMDEVYGAVHVDGFLKPIRPRPGWRAADAKPSTKRRGRRKGGRGTPPRADDEYLAELAAQFDDEDGTVKAERGGNYI